MSSLSKFDFNRAFVVDEFGRLCDQSGPKPQFTEDDLLAARGEGQQTGFDAGLAQARQEIQNRSATALEAMAGQLAECEISHQRAILGITRDAATLA